jgi:transposase
MSCFGVVYFDLIETSKQKVNSEVFQEFLRSLIRLTPENVIYYMDNCKIHHTLQVRGILDFHGIEFVYSSPYSPDYNPIELLFAFLKLKIKDYNHLNLPDAIRKALGEVTQEMVRGWIKKSATCWRSDEI